MTKRPPPPANRRHRRRRREAEATPRAVRRSPQPAGPEDGPRNVDPRQLLHELDVYRLELLMQNEELRLARAGTEAALVRYTALFDFAPLGYMVLAMDGTIREVNHAAARLLGQDRSRLVGKSVDTFVAPPHQTLYRTAFAQARSSGATQNMDLELLGPRPDGGHIALSLVVMNEPDPSMLLALEDIGERQAREQQLQKHALALREADRRKDDFLAALSHELRNPLGPIRTSLSVLDKIGSLDATAHRARAIIDRQVAHLSRLVNELLDVTRIANGKVLLRRACLDLGRLVNDAVEDQRAMFEVARIRLEAQLEPDPVWISADADRLLQSLSNVLGNARKFTPAGGSVIVNLRRLSGAARISIRDTGAGIDQQTLEHIFEPFVQGPEDIDRPRSGLGLGLMVVKGFIELHGGLVSVTSDGPGQGTEAVILLPLNDGAAEGPRPPVPLKSPWSSS